MRIALGQLDSGPDTEKNLSRMEDMASQAARAGARMIVFPEYSTYEKPRVDSSFINAAEPLDGPVSGRLAEIARTHQLVILAGIVETSDEPDRAFNTIIVLGEDGEHLALYRKIHLFDSQSFQESRHIKPAVDLRPATFTVDGIVFGILTCYDLRFPELARSLADAGTDVLLAPSSWVPGAAKPDQWNTLAKARALDHGIFVVAVSQAEPISIGRSLVTDPMGAVLEQCGTGPEMRTTDLPLERITETRQRFPLAQQRRL
ncbi:putative amidohydrolase [Arthrobacter sp. CAN_A6]|uniref:carbon-nitrogen hydrolase family protein n=1 Tax=Arthrobacter sp. CAN_A6 TaxID=2787721 RepID=UPI0018CB3F45